MKFIIGKKQEMSQVFSEGGIVIPVTRVIAGPCFVSGKKDINHDGYKAVQLAFQETDSVNNPLKGFFNKIFKNNKLYSKLKEFRLDVNDGMYDKLEVGQELNVSMFKAGDIVSVLGVSKGKGFQGVVKRHHFHGSPASHGHKDQLRMPGSLGAGEPQHVFKGKRMGGHMGNENVTVSNLEIVEVIPETNELLIKGAVPGARNGLLYIECPGDFEVSLPAVEEVSGVNEISEEVKKVDISADNATNNVEETKEVVEVVEGNNK